MKCSGGLNNGGSGKIYNTVRSTATFTNLADNSNPIDPAIVTVDITNPLGETDSYSYGIGSSIIREGIGIYYIEYTPDLSGVWTFAWSGSRPAPDEYSAFETQALTVRGD